MSDPQITYSTGRIEQLEIGMSLDHTTSSDTVSSFEMVSAGTRVSPDHSRTYEVT